MKTYWLIVQDRKGKIDPARTKRVDTTKRAAEDAGDKLRSELGQDYIVTVETDREACLYKTYAKFQNNENTI